MNVYFAGSIRGGRGDAALYAALIEHLQKHGKVFTEHVGAGDPEGADSGSSDRHIHDRDMAWLTSHTTIRK